MNRRRSSKPGEGPRLARRASGRDLGSVYQLLLGPQSVPRPNSNMSKCFCLQDSYQQQMSQMFSCTFTNVQNGITASGMCSHIPGRQALKLKRKPPTGYSETLPLFTNTFQQLYTGRGKTEKKECRIVYNQKKRSSSSPEKYCLSRSTNGYK